MVFVRWGQELALGSFKIQQDWNLWRLDTQRQ